MIHTQKTSSVMYQTLTIFSLFRLAFSSTRDVAATLMFSPPLYSPELETLTVRRRPFYSPREFSSVILVHVYIPPQANARTTINNLAASITATENANQDSIVLAFGDFSHTNLRKALPKYKQHVKCPTRDDKTLVTVPFQFDLNMPLQRCQ